jgi:uncharacterized protein YcbK (DUF882 family)
MKVGPLRYKRFTAAVHRVLTLATVSSLFSLGVWAIAPSATETAVANGDTRTLHFYHTHTGESIDATYRVDGHYDQAVLEKLNYFLRDWRNNDQTHMDPRLFDVLWEVYRTAGAGDTPIHIYSAYRSPETNAMLRRRSRAVAEHSQHMLGKAMDTTMPGMSMEKIREIGMRLQRGGVGYYPSANFVHLDVGGVRSWPRMNYDQLARLFPDGKTVHIPSNGHPMARYEEARAEIAARGGTDIPPAPQSQGFFAWLFGGGGNTEDNVRSNTPARPVAVAYADPEGDEGGEAAGTRAAPAQSVAQAVAPAPQQVAQPQVQLASAEVEQQGASATEKPVDTVFPLPPHRPTELLALASEEIPLPPTRPESSFALRVASVGDADVPLPTPVTRPSVVPDAIGGLIGATKAAPARSAALPAIITQGTDKPRHMPAAALGYAALETTDVARTPSVKSAAVSPKPLALRSGALALHAERRSDGGATASPLAAPTSLTGSGIIGLRRAAKSMSLNAAL